MKKIINMSLLMALITILTLSFNACGSDDDKDMTPPVISADGITANPINCQQYHPGDVIPFHYVMLDNQELGNFNIEIHNNFDHHTHSTEADDHDHDHEMGECDDDEEHEHEHEHEHSEGNAWVYNRDFTIPAGQRSYDARHDIQIPVDIDLGDYHFMIRLTDRAGWQQLHAVAIKITE